MHQSGPPLPKIYVSERASVTIKKHVLGGQGANFVLRGGNKIPPRQDRETLEHKPKHDTCKPLKWPRLGGGTQFFFWGGGGSNFKGPSSKAPTFPRVGSPKCRSRCGMASRFGVYVSPRFTGATFPRSTFQRQLRLGQNLPINLGQNPKKRSGKIGEEPNLTAVATSISQNKFKYEYIYIDILGQSSFLCTQTYA